MAFIKQGDGKILQVIKKEDELNDKKEEIVKEKKLTDEKSKANKA